MFNIDMDGYAIEETKNILTDCQNILKEKTDQLILAIDTEKNSMSGASFDAVSDSLMILAVEIKRVELLMKEFNNFLEIFKNRMYDEDITIRNIKNFHGRF